MAPSTLDLLLLTFNCGRSFVRSDLFARHLQSAFEQNATGLPDLVVLSLQEVAPLSRALLGDAFVAPYLARFDEAVNEAALREEQLNGRLAPRVSSTPPGQADGPDSASDAVPGRPFALLRARNVGGTAIMLFARHPERVTKLVEAELGLGPGGIASKGAVGLRLLYDPGGGRGTEVTFVAAHLEAMEWKLDQRNADWREIMRSLVFGPPPEESSSDFAGGASPSDGDDGGDDDDDDDDGNDDDNDEQPYRASTEQDQPLLGQGGDGAARGSLRRLSLFKPSSHLFVAGDLNYRTSETGPGPDAIFPSLDPTSEHHYASFFLPRDQLTRERSAGRTLHGLTEPAVRFPPTYKYLVLPRRRAWGEANVNREEPGGEGEDEGEGEDDLKDELDLPWRFAPHRFPSWTDRILYLDLPPWLAGSQGGGEAKMQVHAYDALPLLRSSDHRPVFMRIEVPLIGPEEMAPRRGQAVDGAAASCDPRLEAPVEADAGAWARRRMARRGERFIGWLLLPTASRPAACLLLSLLLAAAGGCWLRWMAG